MERILPQYQALKAHFTIVYHKTREHQAKILSEYFSDDRNLHLLQFLYPVLKSLRRLTKLFESNSENNIKIFDELQTYFVSLAQRVLKPSILRANPKPELLANIPIVSDFCFLPSDSADLGTIFTSELEKSKLPSETKRDILGFATHFLRELFVGFQKRMKGSVAIMSKLQHFCIPTFLEEPLQPEHLVPPFFPQTLVQKSDFLEQYRLIKTMKWNSTRLC